ncbi:MAG: hypothetical protein R3Y53_04905 [Bacillota bacterium]
MRIESGVDAYRSTMAVTSAERAKEQQKASEQNNTTKVEQARVSQEKANQEKANEVTRGVQGSTPVPITQVTQLDNVGQVNRVDEVQSTDPVTAVASTASGADSIEISERSQLRAEADKLIGEIQSSQTESMQRMMDNMLNRQIEANQTRQDILESVGTSGLTASDAAYNISEEGAYGVNNLSENIMNVAMEFADGDPEIMSQMRDAVVSGFEAAGMEFDSEGNASGGLPQVSQDTYTELMKRFDYYEENQSMEEYVYEPYTNSIPGENGLVSGVNI